MSETWYRIAFADDRDVRLAVAPGAHLGEAIATAAARLGRDRTVWPVAAATATPGEVPLGESVGKGVVVERAAPGPVDRFHFPAGVVPALGEGGRRSPVVAGWQARDEDGGLVLEAVVAGDGAREQFLRVVERLPVVDNVEVQIAPHHDAGTATDVWLTPRLKDVRRALRFLDDFDDELLASGHVDVSVYVRAPRSTWRLTQHKTLVLLTDDAAVRDQVRGWLVAGGLEERSPLVTVADGPHLHYRPAKSSPRAKLGARLTKAGLRRVATVPAKPAAP